MGTAAIEQLEPFADAAAAALAAPTSAAALAAACKAAAASRQRQENINETSAAAPAPAAAAARAAKSPKKAAGAGAKKKKTKKKKAGAPLQGLPAPLVKPFARACCRCATVFPARRFPLLFILLLSLLWRRACGALSVYVILFLALGPCRIWLAAFSPMLLRAETWAPAFLVRGGIKGQLRALGRVDDQLVRRPSVCVARWLG